MEAVLRLNAKDPWICTKMYSVSIEAFQYVSKPSSLLSFHPILIAKASCLEKGQSLKNINKRAELVGKEERA